MTSQRSAPPVLEALLFLPKASVRLTASIVVLVVFTALLPAALALATGSLVGSVSGAVTDGWRSPAGRRLVESIVAVVTLFVLQQLSAPALRALAESLGRRVEGFLRMRIMAATLAPAGVAHLEDPEVVLLLPRSRTDSRGGQGAACFRSGRVGR